MQGICRLHVLACLQRGQPLRSSYRSSSKCSLGRESKDLRFDSLQGTPDNDCFRKRCLLYVGAYLQRIDPSDGAVTLLKVSNFAERAETRVLTACQGRWTMIAFASAMPSCLTSSCLQSVRRSRAPCRYQSLDERSIPVFLDLGSACAAYWHSSSCAKKLGIRVWVSLFCDEHQC